MSARFWKLHRYFKRLRAHPIAVPIVTVLVLLVLATVGWLLLKPSEAPSSDAYIVIISHDHAVQTVPSREPTVGKLLNKLNIRINTGDVVEPNRATRINQDDFRINIYRAVPVEIVDGSKHTFAFSAATTPRSIASQAGVKTYAEDGLKTQPVSNFVRDNSIGKQVVVKRSTPVHLNLYGTKISLRTRAKTVGDLLKDRGVKLAKHDQVTPAADTAIAANIPIFVARKGTRFSSVTKSISAPTQIIKDKSLSSGTSAIRQKGSPGKEIVTYKEQLRNGKVVGRSVAQRVIIRSAVTEIVAYGTARVSGDLSSWLTKLRQCESGGNYNDNTGNGYYGAYQFSSSTWHRIGYSGLPSSAPAAVQDQAIIKNTNLSSGGLASQNPRCYYRTGISAFPPNN